VIDRKSAKISKHSHIFQQTILQKTSTSLQASQWITSNHKKTCNPKCYKISNMAFNQPNITSSLIKATTQKSITIQYRATGCILVFEFCSECVTVGT